MDTRRPLGALAQGNPVLLYPAEWDDPSASETFTPEPPEVSGPGARLPKALEPAAPAPEPDYLEQRGEAILRRARTPRTQ
eukprot:709484-Pyramimonas_sp.AAC.1